MFYLSLKGQYVRLLIDSILRFIHIWNESTNFKEISYYSNNKRTILCKVELLNDATVVNIHFISFLRRKLAALTLWPLLDYYVLTAGKPNSVVCCIQAELKFHSGCRIFRITSNVTKPLQVISTSNSII